MNKCRITGHQKKPLNTESETSSVEKKTHASNYTVGDDTIPDDSDADADAIQDIQDKAFSADRYWWWSGC